MRDARDTALRPIPRAKVSALWLALCVSVSPMSADAQDINAAATDRCVRAAVRIVALGQNGEPVSTGSGGVIDARGYILTNFHVVGHMTPEHGDALGVARRSGCSSARSC